MLDIITKEIKDITKQLTFFLIVVIIGTAIGSIVFNSIDDKQEIISNLKVIVENIKNVQNVNYRDILNSYLINNLYLVLVVFFTSFSIFYFCGNVGIFTYLGIKIGYIFSLALSTLGIEQGMLLTIPMIILPNVLKIQILIYFNTICTRTYLNLIEKDYDSKISLIRNFITRIIIVLMAIFLNSLIYTFINFNILVLLKKYFT